MMCDKAFLKEYCSGCGLCKGMAGMELITENGFLYPENIPDEQVEWLSEVCPVANVRSIGVSDNVWGDYQSLQIGYSADPEVRQKASSGGVTTTVACYLLDKGIVDGIIHVGQDEAEPWNTRLFCSETPEQVRLRMGSRYAQSSPLSKMGEFLKTGKKYAFIGKPCDVRALRNFQNVNSQAKEQIVVALSFFCAGMPSETANLNLLNAFGMKKEDCVSLQYRGNGWPGSACAVDRDGNAHSMSYSDSWGKILGRDIKICCKFCMDGIGEFADIACADAWYLKDNYPDFSEGEGRNLIFARTPLGQDILNQVVAAGLVEIQEKEVQPAQVRLMQPTQYNRKATMASKFAAMRLLGRALPKYSLRALSKYSKDTKFMRKFEIFAGTAKRIIQKRI